MEKWNIRGDATAGGSDGAVCNPEISSRIRTGSALGTPSGSDRVAADQRRARNEAGVSPLNSLKSEIM